jgi:uncharacterized membrane protein YkoI
MKKTGAVFASVAALALIWAAAAEAGEFRLGQKVKRYRLHNQYYSQNYGDTYQVYRYRRANGRNFVIAQSYGEGDGYGDGGSVVRISPSEAAYIAKGTWPGAKVLRVQLLPSGLYAVTLKQGGEVSRVLVDARTGNIV